MKIGRGRGKSSDQVEINRELAALKRMFSLAMAAEKLLRHPHILTLQENNVRKGFFQREQFRSVLNHLPGGPMPAMEVAYITEWHIKSEILTWQNSHIDL